MEFLYVWFNDNSSCSFAMQALEQICKARQILGYSYVFAYYMFGNDMFRNDISPEQNRINQDLFENLQVHLESEVSQSPLPWSMRLLLE